MRLPDRPRAVPPTAGLGTARPTDAARPTGTARTTGATPTEPGPRLVAGGGRRRPRTAPSRAGASGARWSAVAPIAARLRRRADWVLVPLLVLAALQQNLSDVSVTAFHPDETRWINRAHYVRDLFDPGSSTWDDGYLSRGQPPLGSYLMGIGLLAQGRDLATNGVWDFKHGHGWNVARGNMADASDLRAARRTNGVVGALSVVVVYFLVSLLTNRAGGLVAGLFLALHPLSIMVSSMALSDGLVTLLVAGAALAAARLADRPSWPRALLLGALLGLGGATKLSPLLLSVPLAGVGAVLLAAAWWARRRGRGDATPGPRSARSGLPAMLLAMPLVAFATFVAVSPYLWSDPIGRTENLFRFRTEEMARQGENWPNVAVDSRPEALRRVGITLGDRFSVSGRLGSKVAGTLGIAWRPRWLDLLPIVAGAEVLLALAVAGGLRGRATLAGLVLAGQAGAIVIGMRSDWARYHLPVLLVAAVCVGTLAGGAWALLSRPTFARRARGVVDAAVPSSTAPRPVAGPPARRASRPRAGAETWRSRTRPSAGGQPVAPIRATSRVLRRGV